MVNLEVELEKFRKTVKENSQCLDNRVYHRKMDVLELIDVFLNRSGNKQGVDPRVTKLVRDCLRTIFLNSKESSFYRIRADDSVKIYNPQQTYTRLKVIRGDIKKMDRSELKSLGFNGFNKNARNFVANVYQIIYNAYLRPGIERQQKEKQHADLAEYEEKIFSLN